MTVRHRGHGARPSVAVDLAIPFFREEEEELVVLRNNRTADGETKVIEVQHRDSAGKEVASVHRAVANELVNCPMVLIAAGLQVHSKLPTRRAGILGHVSGGDDVNFRDRIHARHGNSCAVSAGTRRGRSVNQQIVRFSRQSINLCALRSEKAHGLEAVEGKALDDARLEAEEADEVAPVDRQVRHLRRVDCPGHTGIRGLNLHGRSLDLDCLCDLTYFHRAGHLHGSRGVKVYPFVFTCFKPLLLRPHVVVASGKVGKHEVPRRVRGGLRCLLSSSICCCDRSVGNDCSGGVGNDPGYRSKYRRLRPGRQRCQK